jgi:hypothetical protein
LKLGRSVVRDRTHALPGGVQQDADEREDDVGVEDGPGVVDVVVVVDHRLWIWP